MERNERNIGKGSQEELFAFHLHILIGENKKTRTQVKDFSIYREPIAATIRGIAKEKLRAINIAIRIQRGEREIERRGGRGVALLFAVNKP